jgi:hypothetical protein
VVGPANAELYICELWDAALAHQSVEDISTLSDDLLNTLSDDSQNPAALFSCAKNVTATNGDFRLKGSSYVTFTGVVNTIGSSTRAQEKGFLGIWSQTGAWVEVDADFESKTGVTVCSSSKSGGSQSGYVARTKTNVAAAPAAESVDGYHSTNNGLIQGFNTCNETTLWNDPTC